MINNIFIKKIYSNKFLLIKKKTILNFYHELDSIHRCLFNKSTGVLSICKNGPVKA